MASRHIVITGANRGIGLELTREALALGHRVTAVVRNRQKASELAALESQNLRIVEADMGDGEQVRRIADQITEPVDVLINNAGILIRDNGPLKDLNLKSVEDTLHINLLGPMMVTQALMARLEAASKPVVANMSSLMGSIADNSSGGYYAYRISKTALNMFTRTLAREQPKWTILSLHPGWVKTNMGGEAAPLEPQDSARKLLKVILSAGRNESARFYEYSGRELPW